MDNSGTMCPMSVVGRPGIMMSHMCVDITRRPSANATLSGHVVCHLLWNGVPSMMKISVVPKSTIALFDAIIIAAYAHFDVCAGAAIKIGGGNGNGFPFLLPYLVCSA
jgi:hypothetical protein